MRSIDKLFLAKWQKMVYNKFKAGSYVNTEDLSIYLNTLVRALPPAKLLSPKDNKGLVQSSSQNTAGLWT